MWLRWAQNTLIALLVMGPFVVGLAWPVTHGVTVYRVHPW